MPGGGELSKRNEKRFSATVRGSELGRGIEVRVIRCSPSRHEFAIVVCQGASDLFAVHCKSANCVEHRILLERNVDRLCGTIVYARLKCRWP
jgi:hypothetical protein